MNIQRVFDRKHDNTAVLSYHKQMSKSVHATVHQIFLSGNQSIIRAIRFGWGANASCNVPKILTEASLALPTLYSAASQYKSKRVALIGNNETMKYLGNPMTDAAQSEGTSMVP